MVRNPIDQHKISGTHAAKNVHRLSTIAGFRYVQPPPGKYGGQNGSHGVRTVYHQCLHQFLAYTPEDPRNYTRILPGTWRTIQDGGQDRRSNTLGGRFRLPERLSNQPDCENGILSTLVSTIGDEGA